MMDKNSTTSRVCILLLLFAKSVFGASYCATISSSSAPGASGYFQLDIVNGTSTHEFYLDLSQFSTTCDLSLGLTYHIHSYWKNTTTSSGTNGYCGSGYTGGHFDPNLACGPASEDASSSCSSLGRTSSSGYTYGCSKTLFKAGQYGVCEVGDLSGKYGLIMRKSLTSNIFARTVTWADYLPPYIANYDTTTSIIKPWTSIVFHCTTGARLVCAKFVQSDEGCMIR